MDDIHTNSGASQTAAAPVETSMPEPTLTPPADIIETKDAIIMLLDVPGADPVTLDITLDGRVLTVFARSMPAAPQGYALVQAEYREGNYERRFELSDDVDRDRIEAVIKDGVLRLMLPKATTSAKKIPVQAG